jgi:hypothetical protein
MVYRSDSVPAAASLLRKKGTLPQLRWMKVAVDWYRALPQNGVPDCEVTFVQEGG